ncbi:hypothetical protein RQP46_005867 [Phenoliferia psychrophenolica]
MNAQHVAHLSSTAETQTDHRRIHLCAEVWLTIAEFAGASDDRHSTLRALALVSKEVSAAAYSELYRSIELYWLPTIGKQLLRTFENNPKLCLLVREIDVAIQDLAQRDGITTPTPITPPYPTWSPNQMYPQFDRGVWSGSAFLWSWVSRVSTEIDSLEFEAVASVFSRLTHLKLYDCGNAQRQFPSANWSNIPADQRGVHGLLSFLKSIKVLNVKGVFTDPPLPFPPPARPSSAVEHLSLAGTTGASPNILGPLEQDLNLDITHLKTLRIDAPEKIPRLLEILPTLTALRSFTLVSPGHHCSIPFWEVLATLPIIELHLPFWPHESILSALPPTTRLLHLCNTRPNGLVDALAYKQLYLPALETIWVQCDFLVEQYSEWCIGITSQAVGFVFEVRTTVAIEGDVEEMRRPEERYW